MSLRLSIGILVFCCSLVVAARLIDFLIGKKGNEWLKDHLLVRPWFNLQLIHPLQLVYAAANWFSQLVNTLFGSKLISWRAYLASLFVSQIGGLAFYITLDQLGLTPSVSYEPGIDGQIAWIVIFAGINPFFDFISFAITRYLIRRIASSKKLRFALTFWLIDLVLCIVIAIASLTLVDVVMSVIAPKFGLSLLLGRYPVYDQGIMAAFTGLIPTLLHTLLFVCALLVGIAETSRRLVCFLLERFDEAEEHPLVVLATIGAALIALFSALVSISMKK